MNIRNSFIEWPFGFFHPVKRGKKKYLTMSNGALQTDVPISAILQCHRWNCASHFLIEKLKNLDSIFK